MSEKKKTQNDNGSKDEFRHDYALKKTEKTTPPKTIKPPPK